MNFSKQNGRVSISVKVLLLFVCAFPKGAYAEALSCPGNFFDGKPPVVVKETLLQRSRELCFTEFAVMHSGLTKTPLWSAEHLTRQRVVDAKVVEREDVFHAEPRIPETDRAELRDYVRSGYDRGHMSPSADMATVEGQDESFSLANMVPQNAKLNRNLWKDMEATARALTNAYGDVYVVTGPAFVGDKFARLNGRVIVPSHVYKAIYVPQANAAAVWWARNDGNGANYETISLAELAKRTGIDTFPSLDQTVKSTVAGLPTPMAQADRNMTGKTGQSVDQYKTGSIPERRVPRETSWWDFAADLIVQLLR